MNKPLRQLTALIMILAISLTFLSSGGAEEGGYDPDHPEYLENSDLSCSSAILIEFESGRVLYEKNADTRCYPASTTKMLTVFLALTMGDPEQSCYVSNEAMMIPDDSSRIGLVPGEVVALKDLEYATMVVSGNDGANVIAENIGGTIPDFVELMNRAASAFGCTATHFSNPHGYHDEDHYSTARDMAIIARTAMQNSTFQLIANRTSYTMPADNASGERTLNNTNRLINKSERYESSFYTYANGIKTGQHSAAGYCLAASAVKNGVHLISVVFNSSSDANRYRDTIRLFEYGFTQFLSTSILKIYEMNPRVVDISGFDLNDPQLGKLELALKPTDTTVPDLVVTTEQDVQYWVQNFNVLTYTEYIRSFRAPVSAGEIMGTLTYYPENSSPVVYDLVATRSIAAREALAPTLEEIIAEANADPNPFPRFTFELFLKFIALPLAILYALVRLFRFIRQKRRRNIRMRTINPQERYYQ